MNKKLYTSPDKKLCGVCGGIADYFNLDPNLIRIIVAAVSLATAVLPAIFVYLIAALVMPKPPESYYQVYNNTSKKLRKSVDKKLFGVCGGIAEYFSVDTTVVRLLFALSFLFFGYGLGLYIVCAVIMPAAAIDNMYNSQNAEPGYDTQAYWNAQPQQPHNGNEN